MSRNLKIFTGAVLVFYFIGAVNASAGMYVLSAAALAVILAAYFLTRLLVRGVSAEVSLTEGSTQAGRPLTAVVVVKNAGGIRRTGMSLLLQVDNETVPDADREYEFALPPLPPQSRTEIELSLECLARGVHRITELRIIAHDPIGVYQRWRKCDADATFLGLPRSHSGARLESWELLSPEGRRAARVLRRMGGEFQGIRPHIPGDDRRMVHWKVTAHTGELVVRQFSQQREAQVTIWLDMWEPNHPDGSLAGPTETAISLTATLLGIFSHGDCLMSMAGHGLPPSLSLPSRGESHLARAMAALAEARPTNGRSFAQLCADEVRVSPRLRTVFAITTAAEPALVEVLAPIRQRGAHVVVFLVGGLADGEPERVRTEMLEKMRAQLVATGVCAILVPDFDGIAQAIGDVATQTTRHIEPARAQA